MVSFGPAQSRDKSRQAVSYTHLDVYKRQTGGTGRASGWACDVRKRMPYAVYDKVDFKDIIRTEGDLWARYLIRIDDILESL